MKLAKQGRGKNDYLKSGWEISAGIPVRGFLCQNKEGRGKLEEKEK